MSEAAALIAKAQRYLRSAEVLLRDGDYESSVSRSDEVEVLRPIVTG